MYKMHMVQDPLDQVWVCPKCQTQNVDNFADTARPLCSSCDEDYRWDDVIPYKTFDKLNELYAREVA